MGEQRALIIRPPIPKSLWILLALFVILNVLAGFLWSAEREFLKPFACELRPPESRFKAEIITDPYMTKFGSYSLARIVDLQKNSELKNIKIKLNWGREDEIPSLGEQVEVLASCKRRGFGEYDRWLFQKGIYFEASLKQVKRLGFSSSIQGRVLNYRKKIQEDFKSLQINARAGELLEAILLGERSNNKENDEVFRISGLSHLLAVSGSHLSLIAGLVMLLIGEALGRKTRIFLTLFICILFHIISGAQDSSLRAIVMLGFISTTLIGTHRPDPLHALGFGASALVLLNPYLALSLGFQLSCAAIVGIFLFSPLVQAWLSFLLPYLPRVIIAAISMSFIGQLSTVLVSVQTFGDISLVAPFANLLAVPVMTVALYAAVLGALTLGVIRPLGIMLIKIAELFLNLLIWIADTCARLSWSVISAEGFELYITLSLLLLFITIYLWWPSPRIVRQFESNLRLLAYRILSISLFFTILLLLLFPSLLNPSFIFTAATSNQTPEGIYILNVGQGDATLIVGKGKNAVIDTGPSKEVLQSELRSLGITHIDTVYLTHMHDDHYGGAFGLKSFGVKELVVSKGSTASPKLKELNQFLKTSIREIQDDDLSFVGQFSVECLGPNSPVIDPKANESSLILFIDETTQTDKDYRNILITGDAEARPVLVALSDEAQIPLVDVLKVGHHGSKFSTNAEFLNLLKPKTAVISCGKDNSYGHPRIEVLELLQKAQIPLKRTDLHGTIYLGAH